MFSIQRSTNQLLVVIIIWHKLYQIQIERFEVLEKKKKAYVVNTGNMAMNFLLKTDHLIGVLFFIFRFEIFILFIVIRLGEEIAVIKIRKKLLKLCFICKKWDFNHLEGWLCVHFYVCVCVGYKDRTFPTFT